MMIEAIKDFRQDVDNLRLRLTGYASAIDDLGNKPLADLVRDLVANLKEAEDYTRIGMTDHAAATLRRSHTAFDRFAWAGAGGAFSGLRNMLRLVDEYFPAM